MLDYHHQADWPFISGQMQSPVDLPLNLACADSSSDLTPLQLDLGPTINTVFMSASSLTFGLTAHNSINGRRFTLQEGHIHTPSEHSFDHQFFAGELHLVHQASDGRLAVIAVMLTPGKENPAIASILEHYPTTTPFLADLGPLLPDDNHYLHYLGSLTTPPLSENVEWYLFTKPICVSSDQLAQVTAFHPDNRRTQQALNDRPVTYF